MLVLFLLVAAFFAPNNEVLAQSSRSPHQLKQDAITALEQTSTTDKKLQRTVKHAIRAITRSFSLFLDDTRILPPPFRQERQAVEMLLKAIERRDTPEELKTTFQGIIDLLVDADRRITEHSIATAQRMVQVGERNSKKVAKAQREFEKALRETNPLKAIHGFKEAWEFSQEEVEHSRLVIRTFNDAPDPFFPGVTSNTLSVTFQIRKIGKTDYRKKKAEHLLELVLIIQDSTGSIVRRLTSREKLPVSKGPKQRSFDVSASSVWDGRDEEGKVVPSGTYSYIAFGQIVEVQSDRNKHGHRADRRGRRFRQSRSAKGADKRDVEAVSFPVAGTISVVQLGVTITSPVPDSTVDAFTVLVEGVIDALPGTEVGVTVNGVVGLVSDLKFAALVPVNQNVTNLTAIATDAAGPTASDSIPITVEPLIFEPSLLFRPSPAIGTAPLTVSFTLTSLEPIVQVDLDLEGNGTVDFQETTLEGQTFSYNSPGLFFPTATVTDLSGATQTTTALIQIYDFVEFDELLTRKWEGMKDALGQGDIEGALNFVAASKRDSYRRMFTALGAQLANIDQTLTGISFVEHQGLRAEYQMIRVDNGVRISHFVLVVMDEDGIWRIKFF
jgi:hypothetical protein